MNNETISSENINKELAYLLGVYLGDGSISSVNVKYPNNFGFSLTSIDKDFVENILNCIKRIKPDCVAQVKKQSKISGYSKKEQIYWIIQVGFNNYAKFFIDETGNKHHIPFVIWNSSLTIKRWFIAGILDSDGWISYLTRKDNRKYCTIGLGQVEEGWIWEFKKLLESLGVKIYKPCIRKTKYGKVFVQFSINPTTFILNGLFFTIKRKQDKLKLFINVQRLDAAHPKG